MGRWLPMPPKCRHLVLPSVAPPRRPPCAVPTRPACGMSGFWIRQVFREFMQVLFLGFCVLLQHYCFFLGKQIQKLFATQLKPVESKTRTHHWRVGSGQCTAEQRSSAGLDRGGRRHVYPARRQPSSLPSSDSRTLS